MRLTDAGSISGEVVDANGNPLSEILVRARRLETPAGLDDKLLPGTRTWTESRTDASGKFRVEAARGESYSVESVADGWAKLASKEDTNSIAKADSAPLRLRLSAVRVVSIRFVDSASGEDVGFVPGTIGLGVMPQPGLAGGTFRSALQTDVSGPGRDGLRPLCTAALRSNSRVSSQWQTRRLQALMPMSSSTCPATVQDRLACGCYCRARPRMGWRT